MLQYQSLPHFYEICGELEENDGHWTAFCRRGIQAGILCNLPVKVLFVLSLESAINLAFDRNIPNLILTDEMLENVIERTWRSIQK